MAELFHLPLSTLLAVISVLTGSESKANQSPNIETVLKSRLVRTYETLGKGRHDLDGADLNRLQYSTAKVSLCLVERVQDIVDPIDSGLSSTTEESSPLLGTRDISQIRTLLSIVFKWAIRPLLAELELHRPGPGLPVAGEPHIIDLTERQIDFEDLPSLISRLLNLIFVSGNSGRIRQTWITTSLLNHHAVDMLMPCILLGWTPKPISDSIARASNDIKPLSIRFINILRPQDSILALGAILSSTTNDHMAFTHVPKVCAHLLSNQLRRPDAVRGLCVAVLGEDTEESDAAPLDKLEHIARVLRTVPLSAKPEAYYQFMIPRILELLLPVSSEETPASHKRAAAFALARMISPTFQRNAIASGILLPLLHEPFLSRNRVGQEDEASSPNHRLCLLPAEALKTLQAFLLHTDPSPTEVSTLLTPIVPELYTLLALHRTSKTVDPSVRESLNALLHTWGRIVSSSDVIDGLYSIVSGSGGDWELGPEGFTRSAKPAAPPSISLLTAAELESTSKDDIDIHANPFNLRPDPSGFVDLLKALDRKDVASEVFVRLLNDYRALKETESDPMRTLLHLQLILQLQSQMSATILSRPEHVLSFIKHALVSDTLRASLQARQLTHKKGLGLDDLKIVGSEDSDQGDSDDEDEDGGTEPQTDLGGGRDEIVVTAITLLLSILEGNSEISPNTAPDLKDILDSLEVLTSHTSPTIRQLSREARLVLTARTASTSSNLSSSAKQPTILTESAQETYQKALKLLQDPIIPVRAHGLQLLRDLVSSRSAPAPSRAGRMDQKTPLLDPALVPGILSIFLQSIQDEESYLFLNAVQGLAAMVDGYGKDVLRGVVDVYLSGTGVGGSGVSAGTSSMSNEELDARIRVGEALTVVVKRCGTALSIYASILVPPLLTILRSAHLPTTLRTSALAILAQCVETHASALIGYTPGLADTCVELIQLESVAAKSSTRYRREDTSSSESVSMEHNDDTSEDNAQAPSRLPEPTDIDPLTNNAKVAPFRRSALHFLSQLLRAYTTIIYDSRKTYSSAPNVTLNLAGSTPENGMLQDTAIPEPVLKRAGLVLGYVTATDEDAVTRVMAREALGFMKQYQEASLGF